MSSAPRIIVGLTGGIACYKVAGVVSALAQEDFEVNVVMTEGATKFVAPLTFETLSGHPVQTSPWPVAGHSQTKENAATWHINLAKTATLMLIAPCTMDMLAKLSHGRTDDAVTLVASAMDLHTQPILLAPSMNDVMWKQASTQRNLAQLKADGFIIVEPGEGWQACRTQGIGRMAEPDALLRAIQTTLAQITSRSTPKSH